MNIHSLLSSLSFVSVFIYMYVGIYAYRQDRKSPVHGTFLLLCGSYSVWSFAYAFVYVSSDPHVSSFWNKIAAIGWCSFSAITLFLVLLITENRLVQKRIVRILIFAPAVFFFYMAVFLFGADVQTPELISRIFYVGDFLYNFLFLIASIATLFFWGLRSQSRRVKAQARILVCSSLLPFGLDLLSQTVLPLAGLKEAPLVGQLYAVILILGTYFAIFRYHFLKVPEKVLLDKIQDKILDMVIILDDKYEIIRISKHALDLLNYAGQDLLHKNIGCLFDGKNSLELEDVTEDEKRFEGIELLGNAGIRIPINILYIPIFGDQIHDFTGALLIMQDVRMEHELKLKNDLLYEKSIRDSLTNLYNYRYMVELIKAHIGRVGAESRDQDLSLMMIDIDFFKRVNDRYGHLFGDRVLQTVSAILTDTIERNGYVGRYGGEEFIILFPSICVDTAHDAGERIRRTIANYEFGDGLQITVSIGLAQYRDESCEQLIQKADTLLYAAKGNGRNRLFRSE